MDTAKQETNVTQVLAPVNNPPTISDGEGEEKLSLLDMTQLMLDVKKHPAWTREAFDDAGVEELAEQIMGDIETKIDGRSSRCFWVDQTAYIKASGKTAVKAVVTNQKLPS